MKDQTAARKLSRDRRGQMPFSLIAIVLIVVSGLSAAVLADLQDGSDQVSLTVEGLERMSELSTLTGDEVQELAFQALLLSCSGDTTNESKMSSIFRTELSRSLATSFPREQAGYRSEVNASGLRLAFLRLSLEDGDEDQWQGLFVPAYVSIKGQFQVKVSTADGNLTRAHPFPAAVKVPWPLLNDRLQAFDSAVSDGMGELSGLVRQMLDSLAIYRTLQGWGTALSAEGQGLEGLIAERDVENALNLGIIILQYQMFRNATPCLDLSTMDMSGNEAWEMVREILEGGGIIDPVDVFLRLYGCQELDWRKVFSQSINAGADRIILRWMEYCGIIDLINAAEDLADAVVCDVNDLIDGITGTDLIEEQFIAWLEESFHDAGLPDTLYRYLGAGGPESSILAPIYSLELIDVDGQVLPFTVQGMVAMDFPTVDVLEWSGWGEFKEQYKRGTKEIVASMRQSLMVMAESISRSMFVPPGRLVLDPSDGVPFLEELRSGLEAALEGKEEWLRPAITAAERTVSSVDPLAEATKNEFLERRDEILDRSGSLSAVIDSVANQLLAEIQASHPDLELPWEQNLMLITSAIVNDHEWSMLDQIEGTYDRLASFLTENFLGGLDHRSAVDGHSDSFLTDIMAKTGDGLIGLGAMMEDETDALTGEISSGLELRGGVQEIRLAKDHHFTLMDENGRSFQESLKVRVDYPTSGYVDRDLLVVLNDPRSFFGVEGEYPQLHDTDLLKMKWASFQSVWGLFCSGQVKVAISPGGEAGSMLPMELEQSVPIELSQTISVLTGQPLLGVNYHNMNTLYQHMAKAMNELLRPLLDGIKAISSGLQGIYRMIVDTVSRLVEMGTKVLDLLTVVLQELVEKVQQFVRMAVLGFKARLVEAAATALGEQVFRLSFFGIGLTIRTNPKDLGFREVSVPVSFSLSMRAGDCSIDVTSRLIKGPNDFGLLTNASLDGDDWTVHLVLDPFMDVFRHMVEVRGLMNGRCIEMTMPEVVSFKEVKFALSDIPGVGALLSSIPLPIPGLKGSVDAGMYLKILDGRTDALVINEYELNPAGEDDDREWVELYNPTDEAVNLAGWTLQTSHGVQALGALGGAVLMPQARLVYQFRGQALDNLGEGFPSEESIVLRDSSGRRVDSTPFATDFWNDGRTWQRAQDGADRWEFKEGTKGRSNGKDALSRLDLTQLQEAFVIAVTESIYQLSSAAPTMDSLGETLASSIVHLMQRLTADLLDREVEIGLFVEVAATDYSSSAKVGMGMELSLRCGTLRDMLDRLGRCTEALIQGFGNPFQISSLVLPSGDDIWIGVSTFASVGLPKMVSVPGAGLEVQYVISLEANLAALSALFGQPGSGWAVEGGAAICGVPASSLPMLDLPTESQIDLWLCKAVMHEAMA